MKKLITLLLTITMVMGLVLPVAQADNSQITVTINDQQIQFDQPPVIIDGRTLVPLRAIFEGLGATVDWNDETQTVIATKIKTGGFVPTFFGGLSMSCPLIGKGAITIKISVNDNKLYVNDNVVNLDVPAQIINDRTLVPVRAVSEAFACEVNWDEKNKAVKIENELFLPCEIWYLSEYGTPYLFNISYGNNGDEIYAETSTGTKIKVVTTKDNIEILAELNDKWQKIVYDTSGNIIYSQDSDGCRKEYELKYDSSNDKIYVQNPYSRDLFYKKLSNGNYNYMKNMKYDEDGTLIYVEDEVGHWYKYSYDDNGNFINCNSDDILITEIKYEKVKIKPNILKSVACDPAQELLSWGIKD